MSKSNSLPSGLGVSRTAVFVAASALLLGAAMAPVSANAQEIIIYSDSYYSGDSRRLYDSEDNLSDIGMNDRMSSIRVVRGTWTVCTGRNFGGTCDTVTGDVSNLSPLGLNDRISSIRLESGRGGGHGGRGITLFDGPDYTGDSLRLNEDEGRLGSSHDFQNRTTSVRVHSGVWELCNTANFGGRCLEVSSDIPNLRVYNFNNETTSVRQIDSGSGGGGGPIGGDVDLPRLPRGEAVLYEHGNFRGDRRSISSEIPNLRTIGFNDRVSSLNLGGRWEVCTGANYSGRCEIFRGSIANLNDEGLNDQITSMRPAHLARRSSSGIILFEDVNFEGDRETFSEDVPNLRRFGFNDIASSIQTPVGQWEVCENANYRGRCWEIRGNERNLIPLGANDRITSVRRIDGRHGGGGTGPAPDRNDVVLFEHINFDGRRFGSSDDVPNLVVENFNDIASSLRVRDGRWEFCEHTNYRGTCRVFDADENNLVPLGLNDQFSSFRRVSGGGGGGGAGRDGITIYEHTNFNGRDLNFNGDVPSLVPFSFNDALSSFRIHSGTWELCEHVNYTGRCWTHSASEDNVVPLGYNDRISSMRRVRGGGGGRGGRSEITVFEHTDYRGGSLTLTDSVNNLVGAGWNDVISSFRISGGSWEVCEHVNYGGRCQVYTSNEDNLVPLGWNDRISSIRELP